MSDMIDSHVLTALVDQIWEADIVPALSVLVGVPALSPAFDPEWCDHGHLDMGKIKGGEGSLETAVKEKKKYPYLVVEADNWVERQDVRFARVMQGRGGGGMQQFKNEWMTVAKCKTIGPEFGLAHFVGDAIDEPVMILKSCIGNRSLGWDLLPPGSERYEFVTKDRAGVEKKMVYAGYKDKPESWEMDPAKGLKTEPAPWVDESGKPIDWYAGKQYDDDISYAKKVLSELDKYYPGAQGYEVAGFFFWQGERDAGNAGHAAHYEKNLVAFIKALRKEFSSSNAKFVCGVLAPLALAHLPWAKTRSRWPRTSTAA